MGVNRDESPPAGIALAGLALVRATLLPFGA